ncbi:MAG: hypothetical protein A2Y95_09025 [Deltaproteobacteria bacterium RBG_13_65_10]|nr:MAG: hypothetical protein A2Y95_09025 [Deltaproteobacteria bacterium RBG_13_65_10]
MIEGQRTVFGDQEIGSGGGVAGSGEGASGGKFSASGTAPVPGPGSIEGAAVAKYKARAARASARLRDAPGFWDAR